MKGGHNAKPIERDLARRFWDAGLSRAFIAVELGISKHTVSKWAREQRWQTRKDYAARPIRAPKLTHVMDALGEKATVPPGRPLYSCPTCGHWATDPAGHPRCRTAA